jgi:cephalosporin-C deacetylase-like acetyl esterase
MRLFVLSALLMIVLLCLPANTAQAGSANAHMLYAYLQAEAKKHFDARRQVVANLQTPEEIHQRQQFLRTKFLEALGGFPEKTPLRAKVVGTLRGDGFRVEKVIYESRPDHHVTANLYLPNSTVPVPGVLLPCGHSDNGKAAEAYQRACILLAQNGMAVLCYDPIGQGERNQLLDKKGKPVIAGTAEHTMIGVGALLVGQSTATYCIWDGIRSLDYLASRPEIDPKRLGCTGNSGGGTMTAYLMALDERIAAAVPSCYLTTLEKLFATIGPQDAEQNITGQVAFGMEHADYLTMRAPRPTLMAVATHDYFNIDGAWTTFREASLIYSALGHGERVALFEFGDKHGFSKPRREAAMRWLRRWLVGKNDAPAEGDFKVFADAELQCTRSGQVIEDFQDTSAFQLNLKRAKELTKRRANNCQEENITSTLKEVARLLSYPHSKFPSADAVTKQLGEIQRRAESGDRVEYRRTTISTEPGIQIPGMLLWPKQGKKNMTLYVHGDGFAAESGPGGALERLARSGNGVMAFDLRGMGGTAPGKPPAKSSYFGNDFKESFLAIDLNRPLLGQRVHDLLCIVDYWTKTGADEIDVVAVSSAGPIALHAAALDKRIARLTVEKSLISWLNVVQTPVSYNQLTNVVPDALGVYDLPELAAMIAPRPLTIREAVDARGTPVGLAELMPAYKVCRERYGRLKADKNLTLVAETR